MDEVQLEVLPRRDVQDPVGVFVRQCGQDFQLVRLETAPGNFDSLHAGRIPERIGTLDGLARRKIEFLFPNAVVPFAVVVPLSVDPSPQPGLGEYLVLQGAIEHQAHLAFEGVYLLCPAFGNLIPEGGLPTVGHGDSLK